MASNNDFLLNVVTDIEKNLVDLFNEINIKEQIEVVLRECGKTGLNSETKNILEYITSLTLSAKGNEIFTEYEPFTDPAEESPKTAEGASPTAAAAAQAAKGAEASPIAEEPAAEEPAAEEPAAEEPAAAEPAAAEPDTIQQGGYKVKTLFYKKDQSDITTNRVNIMKQEGDKDFKYYAIESENIIYLHVVKDDGSELDDDDVKKIMSAGFKDSDDNDIILREAKSENGIDRVNKFVIQFSFEEEHTVDGFTDGSLITRNSGDIEEIFLEKNDKFKPGYFMFYFPYGKIVDSLNESNEKKLSQVMRGDEGKNAILKFSIILYGDTPDKGLGNPILTFNFKVLSENNPLYTPPKEGEISLGDYLNSHAVVGSQGQPSVIQAELQEVDPQSQQPQQPQQPQQGPESAEIEELRKQLVKLEEQLDETRQPDHTPEVGVSVGVGETPEEQRAKKEKIAKPIEEQKNVIHARIRELQEQKGGGKKKRTYKKKKKRRSKKKRTPMKKKRRSQKKRTPMKKKIK